MANAQRLADCVKTSCKIDTFLHAVSQQPTADIPEIENYGIHKAALERHYNEWQNSVRAELGESLTQTELFGGIFDAEFETLQADVDTLSTSVVNSPEWNAAAKSLTDSMNDLLGTLVRSKAETNQAKSKVDSFLAKISTDVDNFKLDYKEAISIFSGKDSETDRLEASIAQLTSERNSEVGKLVASIAGEGVGVALIYAGTVVNKTQVGKIVGIPLILAGVGGLLAATAELISSSIAIADLNSQIDAARTKLTDDTAIVASLTAFKSNAITIIADGDIAKEALVDLDTAWTDMNSEFEELVSLATNLNATEDAGRLQANLTNFKAKWEVLSAEAERLRESEGPFEAEVVEGTPPLPEFKKQEDGVDVVLTPAQYCH